MGHVGPIMLVFSSSICFIMFYPKTHVKLNHVRFSLSASELWIFPNVGSQGGRVPKPHDS